MIKASGVVVCKVVLLLTCFCFFLFLFVVVVAAVAVCLSVCMFFFFFFFSPFAKLALFRFLPWFSISLKCSIYIHIVFVCTLDQGSTCKYFLLYPSQAQCRFFLYLKVDGGQLESLRYFNHHAHFITRTAVIILSCNHVS